MVEPPTRWLLHPTEIDDFDIHHVDSAEAERWIDELLIRSEHSDTDNEVDDGTGTVAVTRL